MGEPRFTQGPWSAHGTHDADWVQTEWKGHDGPPFDTQETAVHICKCGRSNGFYDSLLIAAAPEMYETLEHCLKNLLGSPFLRNSDLESEINRVLSKARGEL